MHRVFCFLIIASLYSCSSSHNIPDSEIPNRIQDNKVSTFVDQNGNYYPDNWTILFGSPSRKGAYSLFTIDSNKVNQFEPLWINKLQQSLKTKTRIFILIHGYNNSEDQATKRFNTIQGIIQCDSAKDVIINFYWDGLISRNIGSLKIWFNAAGYSQMAGEFGLRKILNILNHKEIIMISHSRGASVILSALKNPPYEPKFAEDTWNFHHIKVSNQPGLCENNNIIKCIMLAPAVGLIDFRKPEYYIGDTAFRQFSSQLQSLSVTVNKTDKVLKKYIKGLAGKYNPTDLGYNIDVYNHLKGTYPYITFYDYSGMRSHNFTDYVLHPQFKKILNKNNIMVQ